MHVQFSDEVLVKTLQTTAERGAVEAWSSKRASEAFLYLETRTRMLSLTKLSPGVNPWALEPCIFHPRALEPCIFRPGALEPYRGSPKPLGTLITMVDLSSGKSGLDNDARCANVWPFHRILLMVFADHHPPTRDLPYSSLFIDQL